MQVIKGAWIGQTFALAKSNDSGGRKSRIRRSKEERKAMVESFIKKYQKSNNGNFPSLNLTHKEVGGSFYTVREIVREIIQENRVLGPSKLTSEEQNTDRFLEQYPLGSISIEPQIHLSSINESHIVTHILPKSNHHQGTNEELVLNSSWQCPESELQRFDDGQIINGNSQAVENDEEYNETISVELQARESLEVEKNVAEELEASKDKKTHIAADVIAETFPLRSVSKITYVSDGKSSELRPLTGILEENETEKVKLEASNNKSALHRTDFVEKSSGLLDEKAEANLARPLLERNSGLVDDKAGKNLGEPSLESSNGSTTKEGMVLDINDGKDTEGKDALPAAIKPMNTPNEIHPKNLNRTDTCSWCEQSISKEAIAIRNNPDVQHGGSSQKGSNPTLDRINLESWEAKSDKSAGPETNPLLAFVAVFVKFWHYLRRS
uniref:AT3G52170-like helix-turn-helix domain-containing protein n=1 Tax=Davidia involucrata TaxID=16924 RepID=A0A5B6YTX9_DAVIN